MIGVHLAIPSDLLGVPELGAANGAASDTAKSHAACSLRARYLHRPPGRIIFGAGYLVKTFTSHACLCRYGHPGRT